MFRAILLTHRYLGIAVGLLMAMWCLSGVVMMYVPYPQLAEARRMAALAPIEWRGCCALDRVAGALSDDSRISSFQLEMLGDRPALRVAPEGAAPLYIDARSGHAIERITEAEARAVAARFSSSLTGEPRLSGLVERDQWTVAGSRRERPMYLFALGDAQNTQLYVSSLSGRAGQVTTSHVRFWNWLGAVPHWLYPTVLRQNPAAWSQVMIWTSLIGTFLTATGICLGITQLRRRPDGKLASPYKGFVYWHHVPGLFFGTLVLTWVLSGLLSMNPWGLLETQGVEEDMARLTGTPPRWREVRALLGAVSLNGVVSLVSAPLGGELFAVATRADGTRQRIDARGSPHSLSNEEINAAANRLRGARGTVTWSLISSGDNYYYSSRAEPAQFPVIRIVTAGVNPARYYVDAQFGRLLNKVDAGGRGFRWWHNGLHQLDFASATRTPGFRNFVMVPLLLGAALVSVTGAWLGIRRLRRMLA